jgi:D-sedoheptulose 7-phosphate isomerase
MSVDVAQEWISKDTNLLAMNKLEDEIYQTLESGKVVYFFGNGGSAAEASHLAAEFVGKCLVDVGPQSSICLNDSLSSITAIANDWSFDEVFARQVNAHCRIGDLIVGLSTSGSNNVIQGLLAAESKGCKTWLFTSEKFEKLSEYKGNTIVANTTITSVAQELHLQIGHTIIESLEIRVKNYLV